MSERQPIRERCEAKVYVRDTYRVSRRGDGRHFRMHYTAKRCARLATRDGLCAQHAAIAERGDYVERAKGWL